MKKTLLTIVILIVVLIVGFYALNTYIYNEKQGDTTVAGNEQTQTEQVPVEVMPISHATAVLSWAGSTLYTDPTGGAAAFQGKAPANIILVTDIHGDHLSTSTLSTIIGSSTLIVPQAVKDMLPASLASRAKVMRNGDTISEQGFSITAVPMYNVPEAADSRHTKGRGNGYVIERDGYRVYVAGDTGPTQEMRALNDIDMAFVPMNMPFTMTVEEAADAVLDFKPNIVYPYHYRGQNGLSDVNKFKQLVNAGDPDINVILANWYPTSS